jgi:hypothetical protein
MAAFFIFKYLLNVDLPALVLSGCGWIRQNKEHGFNRFQALPMPRANFGGLGRFGGVSNFVSNPIYLYKSVKSVSSGFRSRKKHCYMD